MSQKSANTARRLFAAAGSDERWVTGDENSQTKAQSATGGRDGRWVMGNENSVRNNSQANAQSAAANPGGATSSLPESTKGGAR